MTGLREGGEDGRDDVVSKDGSASKKDCATTNKVERLLSKSIIQYCTPA